MNKTAQKYMEELKLVAHPEGGYFTQVYRSKHMVQALSSQYGKDNIRAAGSCIYYLLKDEDFSAWHILNSDEIWHFCDGSLLRLYLLDNDGNLSEKILGKPKLNPDALFQIPVTAGTWFAAELIDKQSFCLLTCTVFPGFEYKDFRLGERKELSFQFPRHVELIKKFTRE